MRGLTEKSVAMQEEEDTSEILNKCLEEVELKEKQNLSHKQNAQKIMQGYRQMV